MTEVRFSVLYRGTPVPDRFTQLSRRSRRAILTKAIPLLKDIPGYAYILATQCFDHRLPGGGVQWTVEMSLICKHESAQVPSNEISSMRNICFGPSMEDAIANSLPKFLNRLETASQ